MSIFKILQLLSIQIKLHMDALFEVMHAHPVKDCKIHRLQL